MAIKETKKIKTNKLTGKNIITTVIFNDEYADGFGGAVKKIDVNNAKDKYARQNRIDNVFDKISANAKIFETISELNEFDFEFTMGAGSANKKDFDNFVERLNRKCDKQGLSHVQYVYMTCLSYDADMHFHGLLQTKLSKDDIKACYKGLDIVTKGLGLYKESNQRKWTRYIVNKNIRHEMLPMLHGMKIKREDGAIDFKLISKQDELMGYKKMLRKSNELDTNLYDVVNNATEAQIEAVTATKVRTDKRVYNKFGVSVAVDIYEDEAKKEKEFETLTASHDFINLPKEEVRETTPVASAPVSFIPEVIEEDTTEVATLADRPEGYEYKVVGGTMAEEERQAIIDYMNNVMDAPVYKNDNNSEDADEINNINERSVEYDDKNEQAGISSNEEENCLQKGLCKKIKEDGPRDIRNNSKSKESKINSICIPGHSRVTEGFGTSNEEIQQPQYTLEDLKDIYDSKVPMPSTDISRVLGINHTELIVKIEQILLEDEDAYEDYMSNDDGTYLITTDGRYFLQFSLAEDVEEESDDYKDGTQLNIAYNNYMSEPDPIERAKKYMQYIQLQNEINIA